MTKKALPWPVLLPMSSGRKDGDVYKRQIVEGANMITKHLKPNAQNPQGSIEKREGSIHISNLMLVDPATGEATRTGRRLNDKNKLQRFSKKTDKLI